MFQNPEKDRIPAEVPQRAHDMWEAADIMCRVIELHHLPVEEKLPVETVSFEQIPMNPLYTQEANQLGQDRRLQEARRNIEAA